MKVKVFYLVLWVAAILPSHLSAEMSLEQYRTFYENKMNKSYNLTSRDLVDLHVNSMGRAMLTLNVYLKATGQSQWYCQPEKLKLDENSYHRIIKQGIKEYNLANDAVVEQALVLGLKTVFPCK